MPESFGAEYKSPWHPPLRVPNARQFESYEEGVNTTIDFVMGVYNNENVQNAKAINSIKSGIMSIKKGVGYC